MGAPRGLPTRIVLCEHCAHCLQHSGIMFVEFPMSELCVLTDHELPGALDVNDIMSSAEQLWRSAGATHARDHVAPLPAPSGLSKRWNESETALSCTLWMYFL